MMIHRALPRLCRGAIVGATLAMLMAVPLRASAQNGFFSFGFGWGRGFHSYWPHHRSSFYLSYSSRPYYYYPDYAPVVVYDPVYVPARRDERGRDDDYYLHRRYSALPKDPAVTETIADIEKSFRSGDIALLERHVDRGDSFPVITSGHRQKLSGSEYLDRTRDAFGSMKTVRFELNSAQPAGSDGWKVYGAHIIRDRDDREKRYNISFLLKRIDDRWVIKEVTAE